MWDMKEIARHKVQQRMEQRRRGRGPDSDRRAAFMNALHKLPNERFFTPDFLDNHVVRENPSPDIALQIAEARNVAQCTLMFLPGLDLNALADEIRDKHMEWMRNPPRPRQLFLTNKEYSCITVTRTNPGMFQCSDVQECRLEYAPQVVDFVPGNRGHDETIYGIGHLEQVHGVGRDGSDVEAAGYSSEENDDSY